MERIAGGGRAAAAGGGRADGVRGASRRRRILLSLLVRHKLARRPGRILMVKSGATLCEKAYLWLSGVSLFKRLEVNEEKKNVSCPRVRAC